MNSASGVDAGGGGPSSAQFNPPNVQKSQANASNNANNNNNNNNASSINGPQSILSSGIGSVGSMAAFGSPTPSIQSQNAVTNLLMDYTPNAGGLFRQNPPNNMIGGGGSGAGGSLGAIPPNISNDGFGQFPPPEPPSQPKVRLRFPKTHKTH